MTWTVKISYTREGMMKYFRRLLKTNKPNTKKKKKPNPHSNTHTHTKSPFSSYFVKKNVYFIKK